MANSCPVCSLAHKNHSNPNACTAAQIRRILHLEIIVALLVQKNKTGTLSDEQWQQAEEVLISVTPPSHAYPNKNCVPNTTDNRQKP